jgi:hypothetical protein
MNSSEGIASYRPKSSIKLSRKTEDFLESLGIAKRTFDLDVSRKAKFLTSRYNLLASYPRPDSNRPKNLSDNLNKNTSQEANFHQEFDSPRKSERSTQKSSRLVF